MVMMASNFCTIRLHKKPPITCIRLNRPDKLNAINFVMLQELSEAIESLQRDPETKCIVISGDGKKAFSAGADLTEIQKLTHEIAKQYSIKGQQVFSKIENISKPVIAAINGYALGGGLELAISCDFRISSNASQFGFPEINLGLIPGWGGTQRLPLIVGVSKAKQMMLLGKLINAEEAKKIGLVDNVVSFQNFEHETESFAQLLSECPSSGYNQLKKIFFPNSFEGFKKETDSFVQLFSLPDTKKKLATLLSKGNKK